MNNKGNLLAKTLIAKMTFHGSVDNRKWLFSSTDNVQYNYNSKYLFEYVKEHLDGITPYYVINDDAKREELGKEYGEAYFIETKSVEGIQKALQCGVWFTSAGLPVYWTGWKRTYCIVNLWHGVPLKQIGLLDPHLKGVGRLYFRKVFSDNYRYILTTSTELVPTMQESFGVDADVIKVWGQPRNDGIFADRDRKEILEKLYTNLPEYDKIILYAPTFRDDAETRLFPFDGFDIKKLEEFLERQQIVLFIRSHIYEELKAGIGDGGRIREMNGDKVEDVTEMLGIFDLLITDYSSIYIDYLLTEKPMIFLPYDKEEYLSQRGMNFEYDEVTPGPKPESMEAFMGNIEELLGGKDSYRAERKRVNHFFNQIQSPCSEELCNHVIEELKL